MSQQTNIEATAPKEGRKPYPEKWLDCGCCGMAFVTWPEYVDQDQDLDYGICRECQGEADVRHSDIMTDAINQMSEALNPENRASFGTMPRERQEFIVQGAIDKGLFTWTIGG